MAASTNTAYSFSVTTSLSPEEAEAAVRDLLKEEGFGVLTEIDVKATLKAKLGIDFPVYRILGACNPPLAHRALSAEPEIGVLLPCNVVVREASGGSTVTFMDAEAALGLVGNAELEPVGRDASARLRRVAEALSRRAAPPAGAGPTAA